MKNDSKFDPAIAVFVGDPVGHRECVRHDRKRSQARTRTDPYHPSAKTYRASVRLVAEAHNAFFGQTRDLLPNLVGFVIGVIHRDHQAIGINAEPFFPRYKFPTETNRVLLEVIAEAEIPEHLEERVMPSCIAHVFQIVVLTARAYAALRTGSTVVGALVLAQEHVFELDHAGIGEQQRGVIAGYQRTGGHNLMALLLKYFGTRAQSLLEVF